MRDDENVRAYVQRVTKVSIGIINFGGTYSEEEVITNILRSLTPVYKTKVQVMEEIIPLTMNFNREKFIAKLTTFEATKLGESLPKLYEKSMRKRYMNGKRYMKKKRS